MLGSRCREGLHAAAACLITRSSLCPLLHPPRPPQLHCRKAEAIAAALSDAGGFQFGFLHVKAVDDTGHDHLTALKVRGGAAAQQAQHAQLAAGW